MSTLPEGETTRLVVDGCRALKGRLICLLDAAQTSHTDEAQYKISKLRSGQRFLDLWIEEYLDLHKQAFRDSIVLNDEKVARIKKKVEEADEFCSHCEFDLHLPIGSMMPLKEPITLYVALSTFTFKLS